MGSSRKTQACNPAMVPAGAGGASICDLRSAPHFAPIVADRVWRAWWQDEGVPLDALRARLEESLGTEPVPTTLVAQSGAHFLGTVSLIARDVEQRPALSPWVAALWVEPAHRRAGIGAALVEAASHLGLRLSHRRVHLAASPENAGYYRRRGWTTLEADVGGLEILSRASLPD